MKKKNFIMKSIVILGLLLISLNSCKRFETRSEREDNTESAIDGASAENSFNDAMNVADNAERENTSGFKLSSSLESSLNLTGNCAIITKDTIAKKITIDFGTSNCLCNDGKQRRGKIYVKYTGPYKQTSSVRNITFDNYFVNDNKLEGTKTITTVLGFNNSIPEWNIQVNGQVTMSNNQGIITWTSNRTRKMISGKDTPMWTDDVYTIEGTASGVSARGVNFSSSITTPLRKEIGCRWIVSGVIEHTPEDKPIRKINFGDGTCDDKAIVTVKNRDREINLR